MAMGVSVMVTITETTVIKTVDTLLMEAIITEMAYHLRLPKNSADLHGLVLEMTDKITAQIPDCHQNRHWQDSRVTMEQ
jgi:hypothetical protein